MERGPSFSFDRGPERQSESPEQRFRSALRREASNIRWETMDSEARVIAEKIVAKVDLKDQIDDMSAHRDDITVYQRLKQLGIFIAVDTASKLDWKDGASGFSVSKGDSVIDLHMPPVKPEQRTFAEATRSLGLVADYIVGHELEPKYVMGITYEKLANVSRRQGFTVIDIPLPDDIQRGVQRVHDRFRSGKDMGKIMLCFQPTEQFLQRYSTPPQNSFT